MRNTHDMALAMTSPGILSTRNTASSILGISPKKTFEASFTVRGLKFEQERFREECQLVAITWFSCEGTDPEDGHAHANVSSSESCGTLSSFHVVVRDEEVVLDVDAHSRASKTFHFPPVTAAAHLHTDSSPGTSKSSYDSFLHNRFCFSNGLDKTGFYDISIPKEMQLTSNDMIALNRATLRFKQPCLEYSFMEYRQKKSHRSMMVYSLLKLTVLWLLFFADFAKFGRNTPDKARAIFFG
jgi:hypothetical protein